MTIHNVGMVSADDKLTVIKTCIAGLLDCDPGSVDTTRTLSRLFVNAPDKMRLIWTIIQELKERRLRVSGEWTPASLALEWKKTDVYAKGH